MKDDCIDYGGIGLRYRGARRDWEKLFGPIPLGLWLCHSCDNPRCKNPEHWFLGTPSENTQDGVDKGRIKGWNIVYSVLTEEEVRKIRSIPREVIGDAYLAHRYRVHSITITRIRNRDAWKWVE